MSEITPREFQVGDITILTQHGLDSSNLERMQEKFGKNILTPPARELWWKQLLNKFNDPTIQILLAAAIISLTMTAMEKYVLHHPEASFTESLGIFLAVALATLVGYFSERKSAHEFELLNKVKDDIPVKVLRNSVMDTVSITDLAVGDMVRLDMGDKVPADGVITECLGLLVDQSLITGESVPVEKHPVTLGGNIREEHLAGNVPEDNIVTRGTMISDGHGWFLVTKVGDDTEMGKIAANLGKNAESENKTPLVAKLSLLARQISAVGITGALLILTVMAIFTALDTPLVTQTIRLDNHLTYFLLIISTLLGMLVSRFGLRTFFRSLGFKLDNPWLRVLISLPILIILFLILLGIWGACTAESPLEMKEAFNLLNELLLSFVVAVTIIVVAVPEGLPMMVTISLALNMMKMARQNCLVRKLIASETIGSATVICTDKTGTLTENRMTPVWFFFGAQESNDEQIPEELIQGIALNSEANLRENPDGSVDGIGNPTEVALLRLLHKHGHNYHEIRAASESVWNVSHNSQRKMSVTMVEKDGNRACYIKGAPERVIAGCSHVLIHGHLEPIMPHLEAIHHALAEASQKALRVIAFSQKNYSAGGTTCHEENPEFCLACPERFLVALVGIADPIRAEVPHAVQMCKDAGIQVKMITGDAKPTAMAIARQAGIISDDTSENLVLTSEELANVTDEDLPLVAERLCVLARSTPLDKLRLVKALHRKGEVVAMTGDGTNDAPALKFADVGLSMGISGTEVAKEASDIVLLDDNFRSIVTGVWWGRTLFQNIQRFLQFQLSVNVVALLCALIGPMIGIPLPFTVTQLLWINIIMDTFAALALSTDPPRKKTMHEPPIHRDAHIITPSMLVGILGNGIYQVIILFSVLFSGCLLSPDTPAFKLGNQVPDATNLEHLTIFFTIFVMFQFWHKFNCRALFHDDSPFTLLWKNRMFLGIITVTTLVQIIMVQSHIVGKFFRTTPLSLEQWIWIMLITSTILPVAWVIRKLGPRH